MIDPKANEFEALRWAASNGQAECMRLLLPVSDPRAEESDALRCAACNGDEECLRLLLPVSNQKALKSLALRSSARNGDAESVKLRAVSGSRLEIKRALKEAISLHKRLDGEGVGLWPSRRGIQSLRPAQLRRPAGGLRFWKWWGRRGRWGRRWRGRRRSWRLSEKIWEAVV